MGEFSAGVPASQRPSEERLDSWKSIAAYLNRDITTVQRWEKREGMPVHRHLHARRGSVYALPAELDRWLEGRRVQIDQSEGEERDVSTPDEGRKSTRRALPWAAAALAAAIVLAASTWVVFRSRPVHAVRPKIGSIAVLPLKNLSGDPAQQYLVDGITDALIGRLAGIHDLRVTSHTSVMRFRDTQLPVAQLATTLGVDAIVEGSVIRAGDRLRVSAQLIRGATDEHIWSDTWDRDLRDVLTLESDVSQSIADKVEVTVTGRERARRIAPEVYVSYLKGRDAERVLNGRAGIEQSIAYYQDAIQKDPTFAPAFVGEGHAYMSLGTIFASDPPAKTRPKVVSAARKALELDPNLPDAHVLLADVEEEEWQWSAAEAEYRRALALDPDNPEAHAGLAFWMACQGRTDEAVAWMRRGRELDPEAISGIGLAWILFLSRHYDEAARELRSVLALRPDDADALWDLGLVLTASNQAKEAIPVLEKALSVSQRSPGIMGVLIRAYAHAGRRSDAHRLLAELEKRRQSGYVPAGAFVNAYLGLGDDDQAFFWLEQAYRERSNILQFLKVHPYFDPIRGDPRFADLARRTGLG